MASSDSNREAGKNGKTLMYKFALDAGTYDIVAGYYDPWAQWAGDDRHTKITVADEAGTELAVHEDHKISVRVRREDTDPVATPAH